jgi:hypothetical protein
MHLERSGFKAAKVARRFHFVSPDVGILRV